MLFLFNAIMPMLNDIDEEHTLLPTLKR